MLLSSVACFSLSQVKELLVSNISEPAEALNTIAATTSTEGSSVIAAAAAKTAAEEEQITSKEPIPIDRQTHTDRSSRRERVNSRVALLVAVGALC